MNLTKTFYSFVSFYRYFTHSCVYVSVCVCVLIALSLRVSTVPYIKMSAFDRLNCILMMTFPYTTEHTSISTNAIFITKFRLLSCNTSHLSQYNFFCMAWSSALKRTYFFHEYISSKSDFSGLWSQIQYYIIIPVLYSSHHKTNIFMHAQETKTNNDITHEHKHSQKLTEHAFA